MIRYALLLVLFAALLGTATGCGLANPPAGAVGNGPVKVLDPWARASVPGAPNSAVFLRLENTGNSPDTLLSATSSVAEKVELHETTMGENDVMRMSPIPNVEIPAGGSASLEPGGKHIMLLNLKQELKAGEKIDVTLNFEKAGSLTVTAEVRPVTGEPMEGMSH